MTTRDPSLPRVRGPRDTDDPPKTPVRRAARSSVRRHAGVLSVVAAGGAAGSVARYLVALALPSRADSLPWGTFAVNIVGCLLLGMLMVLVTELRPTGRYLRPFLGVGVLGGFTTFSALAVETHALAAHGRWLLADGYVVGSVLAGLVAVWIGVLLARLLARLPVRRGTEGRDPLPVRR